MVQIFLKILIQKSFFKYSYTNILYLTGIGLNEYFGFNLEFYLP
jgi:hypothetical protein